MKMSLLATFLEGILSFLSPCVLPLLPLYMSYLSGDSKQVDENGNIHYKTIKVFITTLFFVLGICLTFVLLATTVSFITDYINRYSELISIIGGVLVIIFGLHEIGLIKIDVLDKEFKLKINLHLEKMNYLKAFLFGFVFSLGWSPCIGPLLANAIFLAGSDKLGYLYILFYGAGLVISFLISGLLTSKVLNFFEKKKGILKYVLKIAGVIMICSGIYMIYNSANSIDKLKNNVSNENTIMEQLFYNQDGNEIRLSQYQGKYVFLNFTTTWCTYCEWEKPYYEQFSDNEEVVCLYVMSRQAENNSTDLDKYIKDYDSKIDILIDDNASLFSYCQIQSFPTTFIISPEGKFLVYYQGATDLQGFNDMLAYAKQLNNEQ